MGNIKLTAGRGVHLTFDNGWTVSIQFGGGNYSSNYHDEIGREFWRASGEKGADTVEIAAWDASNNWHKFKGGSEVQGYVTIADTLKFIKKISRKKSKEAA